MICVRDARSRWSAAGAPPAAATRARGCFTPPPSSRTSRSQLEAGPRGRPLGVPALSGGGEDAWGRLVLRQRCSARDQALELGECHVPDRLENLLIAPAGLPSLLVEM